MSKRSVHNETLRWLPPGAWVGYLREESGLPGPRGNLELAQAFADTATPELIHEFAGSGDEYQALCAAVGLGRLVVDGDSRAEPMLHTLASDPRWRVREGVAMALQRIGDDRMPALWELVGRWMAGAPDASVEADPLVLRAVMAGVCEPRLLRKTDEALRAIDVLERITAGITRRDPDARRTDAARSLRQALGYGWSVAVAASPADGFPRLELLAMSPDADLRWIVRENLKKTRLTRADHAAAEHLTATLGSA